MKLFVLTPSAYFFQAVVFSGKVLHSQAKKAHLIRENEKNKAIIEIHMEKILGIISNQTLHWHFLFPVKFKCTHLQSNEIAVWPVYKITNVHFSNSRD